MTGDDRFEYNLQAIREMIIAAFSATELRALVAYDRELGPLRHEFSPNEASSTWRTRRSTTACAVW